LLEIQDQKHEIAKQALSKDGSYAKSNKLSMKDVRCSPVRVALTAQILHIFQG